MIISAVPTPESLERANNQTLINKLEYKRSVSHGYEGLFNIITIIGGVMGMQHYVIDGGVDIMSLSQPLTYLLGIGIVGSGLTKLYNFHLLRREHKIEEELALHECSPRPQQDSGEAREVSL